MAERSEDWLAQAKRDLEQAKRDLEQARPRTTIGRTMRKRHSAVRKESYGSVTVFWLETDEVLRRLREAAGHLVDARPEVRAVHLFGSLAEGRAVPGSDADLLIVLDASDRRWLDRPLEYGEFFEGVGMPVELFCYTEDEAERVPVALRALETGTRLAGEAGG